MGVSDLINFVLPALAVLFVLLAILVYLYYVRFKKEPVKQANKAENTKGGVGARKAEEGTNKTGSAPNNGASHDAKGAGSKKSVVLTNKEKKLLAERREQLRVHPQLSPEEMEEIRRRYIHDQVKKMNVSEHRIEADLNYHWDLERKALLLKRADDRRKAAREREEQWKRIGRAMTDGGTKNMDEDEMTARDDEQDVEAAPKDVDFTELAVEVTAREEEHDERTDEPPAAGTQQLTADGTTVTQDETFGQSEADEKRKRLELQKMFAAHMAVEERDKAEDRKPTNEKYKNDEQAKTVEKTNNDKGAESHTGDAHKKRKKDREKQLAQETAILAVEAIQLAAEAAKHAEEKGSLEDKSSSKAKNKK